MATVRVQKYLGLWDDMFFSFTTTLLVDRYVFTSKDRRRQWDLRTDNCPSDMHVR